MLGMLGIRKSRLKEETQPGKINRAAAKGNSSWQPACRCTQRPSVTVAWMLAATVAEISCFGNGQLSAAGKLDATDVHDFDQIYGVLP
jgi:hypothetical protein